MPNVCYVDVHEDYQVIEKWFSDGEGKAAYQKYLKYFEQLVKETYSDATFEHKCSSKSITGTDTMLVTINGKVYEHSYNLYHELTDIYFSSPELTANLYFERFQDLC